jgi:hypothetical protein
MSQTKPSVISSDDLAEQREVCGYIFDLLGSLETIATQNRLSTLAQLLAMAKREARDCV